jgi:hypothetical protein
MAYIISKQQWRTLQDYKALFLQLRWGLLPSVLRPGSLGPVTLTYALLCELCTTKSDLAQMHPACSFINPTPYDNLRVHHSMCMNLQRFICADKIWWRKNMMICICWSIGILVCTILVYVVYTRMLWMLINIINRRPSSLWILLQLQRKALVKGTCNLVMDTYYYSCSNRGNLG